MAEIETIVLATDLADSSERATRFVRALWPRLEAKLTLLHVVPESGFAFPAPTPEEEQEIMAEKREALQQLATAFGERCEVVVLRGDPSREIAKYVNGRGSVDLLVMGRHYYSRLQRLLTGIVADVVSRDVECPVLRC